MDDLEEAGARSFDCESALRELYTFLDGEMTTSRRHAIERHLNGCHDCIGAFDFEAELKIVIAQRCREEAPTALRERIARALEALEP